MKTYSFEKLVAWQQSRQFILDVYRATASYPAHERFGLINQMRRGALSISSNIAEGSGRLGLRDQAHFYTIAYGSLIEVLNHIIVSVDLGYMSEQDACILRERIDSVAEKISALRRSRSLGRSVGIALLVMIVAVVVMLGLVIR